MRKAFRAWRLAASRTRAAFMILRPVRRRTSSQQTGPSSPRSCSIVSEQASEISATSARSRFTNTPTTSTRRLNSAPIAAAACSSALRGLGSWKISPIAQAPSDTASSASSGRVIPQIFTCTRSRLGQHVAAAALIRGLRSCRGLIVERGGSLPALDLLRLELVPAVVLDLNALAGLVVADRCGYVVGLRDALAVDLD